MVILIITTPGGGRGAITVVAVGGQLGALDMAVMPALMFMDVGATQLMPVLVPLGQIHTLGTSARFAALQDTTRIPESLPERPVDTPEMLTAARAPLVVEPSPTTRIRERVLPLGEIMFMPGRMELSIAMTGRTAIGRRTAATDGNPPAVPSRCSNSNKLAR